MNKNYPSIKASFGLFGLSIGCQVIAGLDTMGLDTGMLLFTSQLISNLLILAIALNFRYHRVDFRLFFQDSGSFNLLIIPVLMIFNVAYILFMDPITTLIPMPDFIKEIFEDAIGKDLLSYLGIAIIAPIGEELLFRRLMLPGLVRNYGERKGIIWSAFFFALFHLNPWQGISAFFIGIFLAWLYLRTRNIWVPIFLHFFNNSLSFAVFYFTDDAFAEPPNYLGEYQWLILMVISGGLMYLCIRILQRLFIPLEPCIEDLEEIEHQEPSET